MSYKTYGLDTLAILYAMPYALLMWSYVLSKLLQRRCVLIRFLYQASLLSLLRSCTHVSSYLV
jgi:hypothetical protein